MSDPYVFPTPVDRSISHPCVLVKRKAILCLFNLNNEKQELVITKGIQEWFVGVAQDLGWNHIEFFGDQCFLRANLTLEERKRD